MLLKVLTIALSYSVLSTQAQACSLIFPDGMTSEWSEDKMVFWGRPVKSEWLPGGAAGPPGSDIRTTFDVMETLQGELPEEVSVLHSQNSGSCGVFLQIGSADIFIISKEGYAEYSTGSYFEGVVSKVLLHAYYDAGKDYPVQIVGPRYPMWGRAADCKDGGEKQPSDLYCAHESDLKAIEDSYYKKRRNLQYPMLYRETIDETEDLWWRKFWPFD